MAIGRPNGMSGHNPKGKSTLGQPQPTDQSRTKRKAFNKAARAAEAAQPQPRKPRRR